MYGDKRALDQVSNVVGQLLNNSVVESLNVLQQPLIILDDKVDCNSLTPKAARPSNPTQKREKFGRYSSYASALIRR